MYPSTELLEMEQKANQVFQRYAKLYYDNNYLTSVFFFDTDNNGFGSCWLVKKSKSKFTRIISIAQLEKSGIDEGTWDAIHLVTTNVDAN